MHPKGTTQLGKRGDVKDAPPQTLVFVFLVPVILCCSYLCHAYAYDYFTYLPSWLKWSDALRTEKVARIVSMQSL